MGVVCLGVRLVTYEIKKGTLIAGVPLILTINHFTFSEIISKLIKKQIGL